ncbi:hypothetical protein Tco_1554963 [Tanacetum coccineum]
MSNMSEDIQYAGSDTRPPMLDRTDFESWQQRIRLYCLGKDNGENIMKSITEGPFKMGTFIQTPAEETEGALQLGPERARVFTDLSAEEKERHLGQLKIDSGKVRLTKDDRESQLYDEFEHFRQIKGETIHVYYVRFTKLINDMRNIKMTMPRMQLNSKFVNNMLPEWSRFITEVKLNRERLILARNKATVQDGRVVVQDVRGRYNANNQGRPFQRNNARGNVVTGNAGQHGEHENVLGQSDETMSPNFDDDVDDQTERFGNTCGSYLLKLINVMLSTLCGPGKSANKQVKVVNDTLTSELARYKELVGVYEKRTKFKLTEREQKIDEQMRIIISDRNRKETSLKLELHTVQMQLRSTVDHNKSMKEEVTTLKKDFKQKEDKYIEEFLDIKKLKEKVEDRLFKQDQSVSNIWKQKANFVNSLNKSKRVWKATGKLFADIGYQWRPTGKKFTLGKLNCGYQWRPTGKKFALGELCPLTKLSVKCRTGHPLVSGLRLFKTYDGESFKAQELCGKVHWDSQIRE